MRSWVGLARYAPLCDDTYIHHTPPISIHRARQRVVLFSHAPLHPESCTPDCLCWDYQDVLALLNQHRGLVALCLAGHAHAARVYRDGGEGGSGAVFCTLDSPLEQRDAFSTVRVYGDRIVVEGCGANASVVVPLD